MANILVIANQKGGVGKTTTAVNLAAGLARRGKRVLLVDLDIQGSATATLHRALVEGERSIADALVAERSVDDIVVETATPNLRLAPAGEGLAAVDLHLASVLGRERVLGRVLDANAVRESDYVIVDTAPYLGLLTMNALVAADQILVPVSCEYLPILGLKLFSDALGRIRSRIGAPCPVLGYLLTMYDRREKITSEIEGLLRRTFGDEVFPHPVRISTRHKAAPSFRKTIYDFESPRGRGREDYERVTNEVLRRIGERTRPARSTATGGRAAMRDTTQPV
jgi:chromosome partitioning protein